MVRPAIVPTALAVSIMLPSGVKVSPKARSWTHKLRSSDSAWNTSTVVGWAFHISHSAGLSGISLSSSMSFDPFFHQGYFHFSFFLEHLHFMLINIHRIRCSYSIGICQLQHGV